MSDVQYNADMRIVKVPLPIPLIRRMDETIITGSAGFQTRAELISEAVSNLLDELTFPEAPETTTRKQTNEPFATTEQAFSFDVPEWEEGDLRLRDLAGTALATSNLVIDAAPNPDVKVEGPLLGLHNRDYPSIWALSRLAKYTSEGHISFDEFLQRATKAAWYFANELAPLERDGEPKLTVLFPTNYAKTPSAERGFQSFAIGTASGRAELRLGGPFFVWGVATVSSDLKQISVTELGARLLRDLDGLSLELPHDDRLARTFLQFLLVSAPTDAWGFQTLMQEVSESPDRQALMKRFSSEHPEWSESTVSSVTQGYVSRAREWGLLEEKLVNGRYRATDVGNQIFQSDEIGGTK